QGMAAATNALGGSARVRAERLPRSVNTHPELAAVGLTEEQARARGIEAAVGFGELATSLRAVTLGEDRGALKLVVDPEFGEILMQLAADAVEHLDLDAAPVQAAAARGQLGEADHGAVVGAQRWVRVVVEEPLRQLAVAVGDVLRSLQRVLLGLGVGAFDQP